MKRSQMFTLIKNGYVGEESRKLQMATRMLDIVEQAGMLPPAYEFVDKNNDGTININLRNYSMINEWEPETENRYE